MDSLLLSASGLSPMSSSTWEAAVELASFGFQILVVGLAIDGIRNQSLRSVGRHNDGGAAALLGVEEGEKSKLLRCLERRHFVAVHVNVCAPEMMMNRD